MEQPSRDLGDLLSRAREHDEAALTELVHAYTQRLLESVRAELGERMRQRLESQDVMQQVYLDALRGIDRFVGRCNEAFFQWLRSIALHRIRDADRHHFRSLKRRGEVRRADLNVDESWLGVLDAVAGSLTSPSGAAERIDKVRLLQNALAQLGDRQREAIELRYLKQLSVPEAAGRMGCSQRAVRSLCVRALIRLRELLGDAI